MGGDGQALCNKRRFLTTHGKGMHRPAGDGGVAGAGSALVTAKKRLRDEGGSAGPHAPTSVEWHSIPVDQRVGKCRVSLDMLAYCPVPPQGGGGEAVVPPSVLVDHAGYLYSPTALLDYLLQRATAKKSSDASQQASSSSSSTPDSLSHIRKYKRDAVGLVCSSTDSGSGGITCGLSGKPMAVDGKVVPGRFVCVMPASSETGGTTHRPNNVFHEDSLREYWLSETTAQLKGANTAEGTDASKASITLTLPRSKEAVFTLTPFEATYLRTWILSRAMSTFDHTAVYPQGEGENTTSPMAARLKLHADLGEALRVAVAAAVCQLPSPLSPADVNGRLEDLFHSVARICNASTATASATSTTSRLPWFTELSAVVSMCASLHQQGGGTATDGSVVLPQQQHQGRVVELMPKSYAEAVLALCIPRK